MTDRIIGARFTPDIFGGTRELALTFTWDTPAAPSEVIALHDAFVAGEPFPITIGGTTVRYAPLEFSQNIGSIPTTLTVRLKRVEDQ